MSINRLAELKGSCPPANSNDVVLEVKHSGTTDTDKQIARYDEVAKLLNAIKENVEQINKQKLADNRASDEQERQKIMKTVDVLMQDTASKARDIKGRLEDFKEENKKFEEDPDNKGSARAQVRQNLYNAHVRRFQSVMTSYNQAREEFRANLQERLVRQLRVVDSSRSIEEVVQLVESGKAQDVFKKALVSDNLSDTVQDLQDRNQELLKIQRSVQELYELFKDLHTLVEMQGEMLNVIENRISTAKDFTSKGKDELFKAEDYQIKARKRKCCLLIIILCVLVAVLLPILLTQAGNA